LCRQESCLVCITGLFCVHHEDYSAGGSASDS
jgi:hypothetical protein